MRKKIIYAVNNFSRLFIKDKGAHFAYNLGVSAVRMSVPFFLIAVIASVHFFYADSKTKLEYISKVEAVVTEVHENHYVNDPEGGGLVAVSEYKITHGDASFYDIKDNEIIIYTVKFEGSYPDGSPLELEQNITRDQYHYIYSPRLKKQKSTYSLYKDKKRDRLYMARSSISRREGLKEYCISYDDTGIPPVFPIWLVCSASAVSAILFIIGKRQIDLAMKYPRSDIPEELSGAPAVPYSPERHEEIHKNELGNETNKVSGALPDKGAEQ